MDDYERTVATFSWEAARALLESLPGGGLNIAHEAVDRHAAGPRRDHVALRHLSRRDVVRDITYGELAELTSRFANVLDGLGVQPGDTVFTLTGRIPELYVAVLGALKHRAVAAPLFSAFGPEPIRERIQRGHGRMLVTTRTLYERKVAPIRHLLPMLRDVLIVDGDLTVPDRTRPLAPLLEAASPVATIGATDPEMPALLHFTSGTTGMPKGAVHVHGAVATHDVTGRLVLDLHPEDVFWCTADPGWVTGTSYGIVSPLTNGVTSIIEEGDFDADRWYRTLDEHRVTVWYTAPTALRMLIKAGPELARAHDLSRLRVVASVGEPLNPEIVAWGRDVLGIPVLDTWWQTETGGIMVANFPGVPVRPGSMGRPVPGVEASILRRDRQGHVVLDDAGKAVTADVDEEGELALRPGWPSMFRGYLDDEARTRRCFVGGWYVSGDLARRDAEGYLWFIGRADDVIKSAGHLIGPFEVESALMDHPAVAEAGVIGVPDPVAGEVVKAFVVLVAGWPHTPELVQELVALGRRRLGAAVAPRTIEIRTALPHTRSGKVMRRLLKARELGWPEGDLSTLEPDA